MRNSRSDKLNRKRDERPPRRLFVLFCEGAKTEPHYFKALERTLDYDRVQMKTVPGVGVPLTIAKTAVDWAADAGLTMRRNRARDPYAAEDQVWAVFDRDEHPQFEEAVRFCEQNGVHVARSNPCFEVWLILHHEDCHKPLTSHQAQKRLQLLCPEYDQNASKTVDAAKLILHIDTAEARAQEHLARRAEERKPFGPTSTTVHLLTQALRGTL